MDQTETMAKAKEQQPSEQRQQDLIPAELLPDAPALIAAAKSYCHNGKTACRDEEHAERVLSFYLSAGSLRQTARQFHISPNTVKGMLEIFAQAGKLDALKQRLSFKLGVVAELATDLLTEKLLDGSVQANVLPIVVGVAVEKKALIDGEATHRTETRPAEPVRLDDLAAYLQSQGVQPPIDVQSTVSEQNPQ